MPGWPGGLGARLQGGSPPAGVPLGDRLQEPLDERGRPYLERNYLLARIAAAPSKLFGGLVVDPIVDAMTMAGDVQSGAQPTMAFDPQTGETGTSPQLAGRTLNAATILAGGAGMVPAEANSLRMGIRAYHGSPHDFERFDASKIGTGEGAQAYGHGLYLAENEGVAKSYRDNLSKGSDPRDFISEIINSLRAKIPTEAISKDTLALEMRRYDPTRTVTDNDELMGHIQNAANGYDIKTDTYSPQAMASLQRLDKLLPPPKPGRMYEVDIAADPEHFLDWDKPLSEQPQAIQDAMVTPEGQALSDKLDAVIVEKNALATDRDPKTNMMRNEKRWHELAREADRLQGELSKVVTADMKGGYAHLTLGGGAESARRLREAGIPGIKYLDQGSRAPGGLPNSGFIVWDNGRPRKFMDRADAEAVLKEAQAAGREARLEDISKGGTHNYVVFPGNEHLIAILKKYGLPISAAGLAALSQLHPQEAQAQPLGDRLQGR